MKTFFVLLLLLLATPDKSMADSIYFTFLKSIFSITPSIKYPEVKKFFNDAATIELTQAAIEKDLAKVKTLLEKKNVDLNMPGRLWATPIHFVFIWSSPEIITEFIKFGGDPLKNAYSYGSPYGNMLTNVKDTNVEKIAKLRAMVAGGLNLNTPEFAHALRLNQDRINASLALELMKLFYELGLKSDTRSFDSTFAFGSNGSAYGGSETGLFLIEIGYPLFESAGVDWPLAFTAYWYYVNEPNRKSNDIVLKKLSEKNITVASLEKIYGPKPSWKHFYDNKKTFRPNEIDFYLETAAGKVFEYPAGMKMAMRLSLKLVGSEAIKNGSIDEYFQEILKNMKLTRSTWCQTDKEFSLNLKYLNSLPVKKSDTERILFFDATEAFPEWGELYHQQSLSDTILRLQTEFNQKGENGQVWLNREYDHYSTNGTRSPSF